MTQSRALVLLAVAVLATTVTVVVGTGHATREGADCGTPLSPNEPVEAVAGTTTTLAAGEKPPPDPSLAATCDDAIADHRRSAGLAAVVALAAWTALALGLLAALVTARRPPRPPSPAPSPSPEYPGSPADHDAAPEPWGPAVRAPEAPTTGR